jgi:hypothetical protein
LNQILNLRRERIAQPLIASALLSEVKRIVLRNVARVPSKLILEKVSLASIVEAVRVDGSGIFFTQVRFVRASHHCLIRCEGVEEKATFGPEDAKSLALCGGFHGCRYYCLAAHSDDRKAVRFT